MSAEMMFFSAPWGFSRRHLASRHHPAVHRSAARGPFVHLVARRLVARCPFGHLAGLRPVDDLSLYLPFAIFLYDFGFRFTFSGLVTGLRCQGIAVGWLTCPSPPFTFEVSISGGKPC